MAENLLKGMGFRWNSEKGTGFTGLAGLGLRAPEIGRMGQDYLNGDRIDRIGRIYRIGRMGQDWQVWDSGHRRLTDWG
jgi:hypothetical protein